MMEAEPCVGPPSGGSAWVHCPQPSPLPFASDRQPSGSGFALKSSTLLLTKHGQVLADIFADESRVTETLSQLK